MAQAGGTNPGGIDNALNLARRELESKVGAFMSPTRSRTMAAIIPTRRAAAIEYAIRDVVVPALELEKMGHEIIKMNIGDPLAYPGLPTPIHMVEAFKQALDRQDNGYSPSYGIPDLREAIAVDERSKGWACQA